MKNQQTGNPVWHS